MGTECNRQKLLFESHGRREVTAAFDGGRITSDAGGLLLREVEERFRILWPFVDAFTDYRSPDAIEFTVEELLRQRVMGIALGYEDLNDHQQLRHDPLLALMAGRSDITGQDRREDRDKGVPLAGKSTLNRLELTPAGAGEHSRYKKIVASVTTLQNTLVDTFIRMRSKQGVPQELILDLDATDDPVHGDQLGKFFHGYYRSYCYLPLYTFCGAWPLGAVLRPSNIDGCAGTVQELERIVPKLRAAWPGVKIIIRADSGFCRDELMTWCEQHGIDYVLGMARNARLQKMLRKQMEQARREHLQTGRAARHFRDFRYQTCKQTWSRVRRVVGKAEYMGKGANPRFVVTSLSAHQYEKRYLYEELYCARGEMENRIKEQLDLFADRASCHSFRGNEIRLWWSMAAHLLVVTVRLYALRGTELQKAQAPTLRTRLFKIGAVVSVSVRRVYVRLSSAFPLQKLFSLVLQRLQLPQPVS